MTARDPELPRLPVEVFPRIFKFLPGHHSSLLAMALTCSYLHRLAEPVLYTSFYSYVLPVCEGFSKTVIEYPRLAQMVESYRIHEFFLAPQFQDKRRKGRGEWLELIARGLRCLVNLRHLEFYAEAASPSTTFFGPTIDLLRGCTFQLESLVWNSQKEDLVMEDFLDGQKRLKRLELDCGLSQLSLDACPGLVMLKANEKVVEKLLPGRKIKHIRFYPMPVRSTGRFSVYLNEMKEIRSLVVECTVSQLPAELELFRALRYLEILAMYQNEVHRMVGLPELHTIVLWSGLKENGDWEQRDVEEQRILVLTLSQALPKLVRVDIGDIMSSHVSSCRGYRRWIRCQLQPDLICHSEIELDRLEVHDHFEET